jgi:GT2 family glycosyltransferase
MDNYRGVIDNIPALSIVVPVWRSPKTGKIPFQRFVESLVSNTQIQWELIAIVNTSAKEVTDYVKSCRYISKYFIFGDNIGVPRAWQVGASYASGEFICFSNEDVIIGKQCLEKMIETLREYPKAGQVGPKGAIWGLTRGGIGHLKYVEPNGIYPCNAISGFLFMITKKVFELTGGFDSYYTPCSYEDIDFSFNVIKNGFNCYAVDGLHYKHSWGISSHGQNECINYIGLKDQIGNINKRNHEYFQKKWEYNINKLNIFNATYYNSEYFSNKDYKHSMNNSRVINGRKEPPLVETLCNMIINSGVIKSGGKILDLGCAYGFAVQKLVSLGYDAYGIDLSPHCIEESPIPHRLSLGNALDIPIQNKYDCVIATDLFEHLNKYEVNILIAKLLKITNTLFILVNKSDHEPSHINLQDNYSWIKLFEKYGFYYNYKATNKARLVYAKSSVGTECWDQNCLIFENINRVNEFILSPYFIIEFFINTPRPKIWPLQYLQHITVMIIRWVVRVVL